MAKFVYTGSKKPEGGINCFRFNDDGTLEWFSRVSCGSVAYTYIEGRYLYALLREPFMMSSGVLKFYISGDGTLNPIFPIRSVHGTIAAHLYVENGTVWCANYINGTVICLPENSSRDRINGNLNKTDCCIVDSYGISGYAGESGLCCDGFEKKIIGFDGSGPNHDRQSSSHPHCVIPTPDGKYLCIVDLGTDSIHVLTKRLEPVSEIAMPAGSGPRHLVFSPDGKYAFCITEMKSSICVMRYENGNSEFISEVSSLPPEFSGESCAAAIRISDDGRHLYASNRGDSSIAVFEVDGPELKNPLFVPCGGSSPRDIFISGEYMLCANEFSDDVTVLRMDSGLPGDVVSRVSVPMPWSVIAADFD